MQIQPTNIHDSFFKNLLSKSEMADTFLREHLPRQIAELLSPQPPEQISGPFVDEELSQHHSDLLFRLRLKTGDPALAYVLLEHKSAPDRLARLQLLRYIVRILVDWHEEHKKLPLPPVVPMLAHQGPDGWKISTDFGDLYGTVPEALRPYLISFQHALVDLAQIEDSALSEHLSLRSFLRAMKYIQRKDLPERFELLMVDSAALPVEDIARIVSYVARGPVPVSRKIVEDVLGRLEPSEIDNIRASFGAEFFEQGHAEGEAKGQARGLAKALMRLLEKRFDPLPPHLCDRIYGADVTSIENWLDQAVDALDLQSIFGTEASGGSRPLEHETH